MDEDYIVTQILSHLQGYIIESDTDDSEDIISDLEYDKKLSQNEVLQFYNVAKSHVLSYLNMLQFPTITYEKTVDGATIEITETPAPIYTALYMWTAGLIWEKYNIRENNNEDDTSPFGFGDKLVSQAKEMLKPYKYYCLNVY